MKGSVTIYFSIILVSVLVLVSVISESARVNVIQAESKNFTVMAGESVLAGYARQVLKDYGILLVWENQPIEEQVKTSIQANINMADLEGPGTNFMNTDVAEVTSNSKQYITENGGNAFVNQILKSMTYGGAIEAADTLITEMNNMENHQEVKLNAGDAIDIVDKKDENVQKLVTEAYAEIDSIKQIKRLKTLYEKAQKDCQSIRAMKSTSSKELKEKVSDFHKTSEKIDVFLEKRKKKIDQAMSSITKYMEEKKQILEETGQTFEGKDLMEENLEVLNNIKEKIQENKNLFVSNCSGTSKEDKNTFVAYVSNVGEIITQFQKLKRNTVTKKDKKNQSLYERAKALLTDSVLALVVEDVSKLSTNTVSDPGLPSKKEKEKESPLIRSIKNKALLTLYDSTVFGNYTEEKTDTALKYEVEYLMHGKDNDKENLLNTVEQLVGMRNILNAAYLLTDTQKMSEIKATALSVAAALAMPFLEPMIQAVLVEAWALAEAVSDVKELLRGEKVALIKTKALWRTDLQSLSAAENHSGAKGLTYMNYCQLLLMTGDYQSILFRMMDLIQMNIQKRYQPSFQMAQCVTSVHVTAVYQIQPMFTALPWCIRLLSNDRQSYRYQVSYQNEY